MNQNQELTRASLILRLQNADDIAAWEEFASLYGPVITRVASRRGFQLADAENIAQEVFLSVANSITDWLKRPERGSFRAWLLRITHNTAVDMLTRKATRPLGRDDSGAQHLLANLPAPSDLSDALELEYKKSIFSWAAKQVRNDVADHTWQAFWLTSIEGLAVKEVAEKLNTRSGNIYIARSRVMKRIKDLVQYYEGLQ